MTDEPRNLLERRNRTVPGQHCETLEEFLYNVGVPELWELQLREICHYLEALAFAEMEKEMPTWVADYIAKKIREAKKQS